ncbi:MAG: hypothetical protein IPG24_03970 [Leptospiraceae bacterium]|nr:hypothetical protein [Leptospiraceae bacterium]
MFKNLKVRFNLIISCKNFEKEIKMRLDKLKGLLEITKTLIQVLSAGIIALTSSLIILIRSNDTSLWIFIGIFLNVLLITATLGLLITSFEITDEMEILK